MTTMSQPTLNLPDDIQTFHKLTGSKYSHDWEPTKPQT